MTARRALRDKRAWRFLSSLLIVPVLAACDMLTTVCTSEARAGIDVRLTDARTGGPVQSEDILVVAMDGTYADSVRFTNDRPRPVTSIGLAFERTGVYGVQVTAEGYRHWEVGGIRVTEDECHVRTESVEASLEPVEPRLNNSRPPRTHPTSDEKPPTPTWR